MAPMYYRGASAAILVYDITSEESFTELISWMEGWLSLWINIGYILIAYNKIELNKNIKEKLIIHVVGNKCDLESERKVSYSRVLEYCNRLTNTVNGIHEVSAKTDQGIHFIPRIT